MDDTDFWNAGHFLAETLDDLLSWAELPDPSSITDGWSDAYGFDVSQRVLQLRKCAKAKVHEIESRLSLTQSLAMQFIRMMRDNTALSSTPVETWPMKAFRDRFDDLNDLSRYFRKLSLGDAVPDPAQSPATGTLSRLSPWIDTPQMIELMKMNGRRGTEDRTITRTKSSWQAESQAGSGNRVFRFNLDFLDSLGIVYPPGW